jgi:L-lactate dehydrogenase complex protein LldF
VHLVLLDNGRSQAYADEQLRKTLQCIRCGACMNHCPVYTRIGGHAYGTTYPGPIGKIISPHMLGLEATAGLTTASSLCGACGEVCPVKIPIPELLIRLREEAFSEPHANPAMRGQGAGHNGLTSAIWRAWGTIYGSPAIYRSFSWLASRFRWLTPRKQAGWTSVRTPMQPAPKRLRDLIKERN